jgi:hypothetical protein
MRGKEDKRTVPVIVLRFYLCIRADAFIIMWIRIYVPPEFQIENKQMISTAS